MELLKPIFKLPEVAYGAGVSASNLTNWYDRELVEAFCTEKDGWKRFSAMDAYHVALIKQMVVLGVPIPHANEISREYLEFRMTPCRLVPVSPTLFVVLQGHEMLFVEPAGDQYRMIAYDQVEGIPGSDREFPASKRGHIVLPVGPILEVALSRALTGRDDIGLDFDKTEGDRFIRDIDELKDMQGRQQAAARLEGVSSGAKAQDGVGKVQGVRRVFSHAVEPALASMSSEAKSEIKSRLSSLTSEFRDFEEELAAADGTQGSKN